MELVDDMQTALDQFMLTTSLSLIAVLGFATGMAEPQQALPKPFLSPPRLVESPVETIRKVLPDGWRIEVTKDAHPFYRPRGKGLQVYFLRTTNKNLKAQFSAGLWIMPADYQDGGDDPTRGKAQTYPPKLIASFPNGKVYLWDSGGSEWNTMRTDLISALTKRGTEPSQQQDDKR